MTIYVKKFLLIPYFLFFLVFHNDFVKYINFTHVAASNTATDDMANIGHIQNI